MHHTRKNARARLTAAFAGVAALAALATVAGQAGVGKNSTFIQYGTMREAIGKQQSQGRVVLADVASMPHFYGVAALEGLQGEVTFFDSKPTITGVTAEGTLEPKAMARLQATLLAGASVPAWREQTLDAGAAPDAWDDVVRDAGAAAGLDVAKPFVFTVEGEFSAVRLHVIHGACPMHARMNKIEIPAAQKPFEGEYATLRGRVVGLYAEDAVGKLTHPATSTHMHVLFDDPATGQPVTGHVERLGVVKGAVLKVPGGE